MRFLVFFLNRGKSVITKSFNRQFELFFNGSEPSHFKSISKWENNQVPILLRLIINYWSKSMPDFKINSNNNSLKINGGKIENRIFKNKSQKLHCNVF